MGLSLQPPRRIGVFGGAFDPPHAAHVKLVQAAMEELQLDELRVLPTGQAWHKSRPLSSVAHRVAMTQLAFAGLPGVVVDLRETTRAGPSYTVDSLQELTQEFAPTQLFLLIGEDQAQALPSWHQHLLLPTLAIICVAARDGSAGTAAQLGLQYGLPARFVQLHATLEPISATDIRARVARGQSIVPLVSEPVARYIDHHHLYQTA